MPPKRHQLLSKKRVHSPRENSGYAYDQNFVVSCIVCGQLSIAMLIRYFFNIESLFVQLYSSRDVLRKCWQMLLMTIRFISA